MADKTVADKTSVVYRNVRPAGIGVCAALVVFFAGCGEEPTVPLDSGANLAPQAAFSVRIDCAVDIGKGGDLGASRPAA